MRTNFGKFRQPYRSPISSSFINDKFNFIIYHAEELYGKTGDSGLLDDSIESLKPTVSAATSIDDELNNLEDLYNKMTEVSNE